MRLLTVSLLVLLISCSTVTYNDTVYNYHYNKAAIDALNIRTIALATVNVSGEPTRSILRKPAARIDSKVIDYLRSNGYEIAPAHIFDNAWRQALYNHGDFYDPTSGKVDRRAWQAVMSGTLQGLQQRNEVDAVLFTDVIEHDVQHSPGMNHYARWYGVTRKPATQGAGTSVPADFNWSQTIKAATLVVTIYDLKGNPLFSSRGGLETLHAVDMKRTNQGFVRRKKILKNESNIKEGIELAFHPLITMQDYPGTPSE